MFKKSKKHSGFTLIEVLIVVVIMAVLAATIIPQFASSTDDAKASALKFNLHTLRSQIEMYKLQHNGLAPVMSGNTIPGLIYASDASGATVNSTTTDPNHPYGPYIQGGQLPTNPYTTTSGAGAKVITLNGTLGSQGADFTAGWVYSSNATTAIIGASCDAANLND
jgi:prepilin-type N-terminal cleavage/methylation domain-containing protein